MNLCLQFLWELVLLLRHVLWRVLGCVEVFLKVTVQTKNQIDPSHVIPQAYSCVFYRTRLGVSRNINCAIAYRSTRSSTLSDPIAFPTVTADIESFRSVSPVVLGSRLCKINPDRPKSVRHMDA